jgi:hypothetical protein
MDDGNHESPTKDNMIAAYKKIVSECEAGDALFLHYSGHGAKIRDDDFGEEEDGYDESLVPLDYQKKGMIRDDDLYEIIVKGMPVGVHVVCLVRILLYSMLVQVLISRRSHDFRCFGCVMF